MAATDVLALHQALVQRLKTSMVVYNEGDVPRGAPKPYAVIAGYTSTRTGASRFMQPGHLGGPQIRFWHDKKYTAMQTFAQGCGLLDNFRLTIADHVWERGRLDYITDFPEPDPEVGGHVVVSQYRSRTGQA